MHKTGKSGQLFCENTEAIYQYLKTRDWGMAGQGPACHCDLQMSRINGLIK